MQRFTANFPKAVVETRFPMELGHRDWLISILDDEASFASVVPGFARVVPFFFDDETDARRGQIMTEDQAAEMAQVIREAEAVEANVWVHCTAGICRSGAVVEVLKLLGWTVVEDFSPWRVPNTHVFTMLRKQFPQLEQSWDKVIEKKSQRKVRDWE